MLTNYKVNASQGDPEHLPWRAAVPGGAQGGGGARHQDQTRP